MKDDDPIRRISKDVFDLLVKTHRIEHIEKDSLKTNIDKIKGIIEEEVNDRFKHSPISRLENYLAFDGIAQEQTLTLILKDVIGRVELEMENVVTVSTRAERKPGEAAIKTYDDEDEGEGKKEREKEDDSPKPNSKDSNAFPLISMLILGGTLWCSLMHFVVKWCEYRIKPRKTTNRSVVVEFLKNLFRPDRETRRYNLACIAHIGSCISILLGIIILVPYYSCQHYTGYGLTFDDILHDSFYMGMWVVFVAILLTYCFSREGWNPLLRLVNNRKWFEPNDPKAHGIAFLFFGVLFFLYVYGTFNYHVWNILVNDEHIHSGMLATGCYKEK